MAFQRITVNPEICRGKPTIRGLRFPVSRLLGLLAAGETRGNYLEGIPLPGTGGHRRSTKLRRIPSWLALSTMS